MRLSSILAAVVLCASSAALAYDGALKGVAVFTASKTGLMYEASVGGQKFGYQPFGAKKK